MSATARANPHTMQPGIPGVLGVRALTLALVWLTVASGAIVFNEPAPVDVLTMGLILALPVAGLVSVPPLLLGMLSAWLVLAAAGFIAANQSFELHKSTVHAVISLYLYLAAFIFAAFVANRAEFNTRFILHAYLWAAFIGSVAGVLGYFDALPGASELFTKYSRAAGTFKDPNVFGAFLVPACIYALHLVVTRPLWRAAVPGLMLLFLTLAITLSFSRGAWINLAVSALIYGYLSFCTARTHIFRAKLICMAAFALLALGGVLALALQNPEIADRMADRASLTQSYDVGPEGRFGGHLRAQRLIIDNPVGIGALQFSPRHHGEDVHQVYLNMFLNTGWTGGLIYAALVLLTVIIGLSHALRRTSTQPLFIVIYAAFIGVALEGLIIDTDHWRHFYLLMALLWGLMAAPRDAAPAAPRSHSITVPGRGPGRGPRIVLPGVRLLGPQRPPRIIGRARRSLPRIAPSPRRLAPERPRRPERITYR